MINILAILPDRRSWLDPICASIFNSHSSPFSDAFCGINIKEIVVVFPFTRTSIFFWAVVRGLAKSKFVRIFYFNTPPELPFSGWRVQ